MKKENMDIKIQTSHYLVFTLAGKQFALPLESVQRVVHAVEVSVLPRAPEIVCGLVNYKGQIIPVINISRRFHLPEREIDPDQHFIIVQSKIKRFALVADDVTGVTKELNDNITPPSEIFAGVEFLAGVIKLPAGIMFIPDLDKILTHEEETALKSAVQKEKKTHASN